jgi:hypothetical protein
LGCISFPSVTRKLSRPACKTSNGIYLILRLNAGQCASHAVIPTHIETPQFVCSRKEAQTLILHDGPGGLRFLYTFGEQLQSKTFPTIHHLARIIIFRKNLLEMAAEPRGTVKLIVPRYRYVTKADLFPALESSLNKLFLKPSKSSASFQKKQSVAESWEDEELESGDEADRPLSPQQSADYPSAPPPTPISPSTSFARENFVNPYGYGTNSPISSDARTERAASRPEKTDAVAKRLIAGALGVKAPKKTEEQKAYDKAIKEKELKKRNQEKEAAARAKEEAEKAKAAIWDD